MKGKEEGRCGKAGRGNGNKEGVKMEWGKMEKKDKNFGKWGIDNRMQMMNGNRVKRRNRSKTDIVIILY